MLRDLSQGIKVTPELEFLTNDKFDNLRYSKRITGPTAFTNEEEFLNYHIKSIKSLKEL